MEHDFSVGDIIVCSSWKSISSNYWYVDDLAASDKNLFIVISAKKGFVHSSYELLTNKGHLMVYLEIDSEHYTVLKLH